VTPERWQQVAGLFEAALEQAPAGRSAFLASACGDDVTLRAEIESLLQEESSAAVADDLPGRVAADMFSRPSGVVAGTCIDVYRIIGPLGAAGMGEVYYAYDSLVRRPMSTMARAHGAAHNHSDRESGPDRVRSQLPPTPYFLDGRELRPQGKPHTPRAIFRCPPRRGAMR